MSATTAKTRERGSGRQARHRRRQQAQLRAGVCRSTAIRRGYRYAAPLIDAIADYMTASDKLPYPSQETLARECGVTPRTIRTWTMLLERIGVLTVFRSNPRHLADGTWTRQTSRYLLADRRALHEGKCSPMVRRRPGRAVDSSCLSPTGSGLPVTLTGSELGGVGSVADDPPNLQKPVPVKRSSSFKHEFSDEIDSQLPNEIEKLEPAEFSRRIQEMRAVLNR